MGFSTFTVGLLPTFEQVGWPRPSFLSPYVCCKVWPWAASMAERRPTSQNITRRDAEATQQSGSNDGDLRSRPRADCDWRLPLADSRRGFRTLGLAHPFLFLIFLLALSVYIRIRLRETPVFLRMKAEGRSSQSPVLESFFRWPNNKFILLSLLGATAGQGVVWYTGQFYTLFFLTITLHLDYLTSYLLVGAALAMGTPFFVFFGGFSQDWRVENHPYWMPYRGRYHLSLVSRSVKRHQPGAGRVSGGEPDHAAHGLHGLQRPHLRRALVKLQYLRSSHGFSDKVGTVLHQD